MNGNRYLLDTNAVISLLQRRNTHLLEKLEKARWIGISVITYLEFLSFPDLTQEDIDLLIQFTSRIDIVNLDQENHELMKYIISLRKKYKIKMPDAIIAATSLNEDAALVTADKQLFKINEIKIEEF